MADEQVIALLQEIRDLQKQHIENYKNALQNQQESIAIQRRAVRRQRLSLVLLFVLLIVFLLAITLTWHR